MKKIVKSVLATLLASTFLISGCSNSNESTLKIGISQVTEHPALDASREGFIKALADNGYVDGENIKIDYQNGQGDQSNLKSISQKLVSDKSDLVLTIGTQASVSMAAETKEIPIVVTAVTDPEKSGLVVSNEKPETNVTGTSDMNPITEQLDLLMKLVPECKTLAIMYNSSEDNSVLQAEIAEKYAVEQLGLQVDHKTITSTNDIAQVAESIVGKYDAIYVPTDNTMAEAIPTLSNIAVANKIPVIAGEENMTKEGCLATISFSYYDLGYKSGEMAVKILKDGAKPQEMAIEYAPNSKVILNQAMFNALGMEIPADLAGNAEIVNAQ